MNYVANPAWVDRILSKHWDDIVAASPRVKRKRIVPVESDVTRTGKRKFSELGCGHYGCVLPTNTEAYVFKITSDVTEAMFVAAACKMDWPEGIVRYLKIVEVPESYRSRRVFVLWREAAHNIGFPMVRVQDNYEYRSRRELLKHLDQFKNQAAIVRDYVKKAQDKSEAIERLREEEDFAWSFTRDGKAYRLKGAQKAAVSLQHCEDLAEIMEHTYGSDLIGSALGEYIKAGLLLADVHGNNVGMVSRIDDYDGRAMEQRVITDPGHMVPLRTEFLSVKVPQL